VLTQNRATALSINAILVDSVGAGTNVVFGTLAVHSLRYAFLCGAGLCFAGAILFAVWHAKQYIACKETSGKESGKAGGGDEVSCGKSSKKKPIRACGYLYSAGIGARFSAGFIHHFVPSR
jgi:hypothetical protein